MPKSRLTTLAYLVLVFGSGTMVGAVAHRLYTTSSVTASTVVPKTPAQAREDFLRTLHSRVGASTEQVGKINAVLNQAKEKYNQLDLQTKPLRDKIDQERVAAILATLSPEQQKVFLVWRAEAKAKREQKAAAEKALIQSAPATRTR